MKRLALLGLSFFAFVLALAPSAFGQSPYSYYYNETFSSSSLPPTHWTKNGSLSAGSGGLTESSGTGSLISNVSVPFTSPATAAMYEVETTLNLTASGGTYTTYLDASSNALSGSSPVGTFYSVEFAPTFNPALNNVCTATVTLNKTISGSVTTLATATASCSATTTIRAVRAQANLTAVFVNSIYTIYAIDSSISSGQPGVGVSNTPSGNSMVSASLGQLDVVAPNTIPATSIGTSVFSNRVDVQWQGVTDNSGGSGVSFYAIYRGSSWIASVPASVAEAFSDTTVSAGTYTYTIYPLDFHWNHSATSFTVVVPGSGAVDPRRVGQRPTGAYWGASPEQIDVLSGNLNFSLPLVKAQGRNGWGVGFSLSYNSQNWRKDSGGTWNLGRNVGYGYGWKLLAGSITPYWSDYFTIDHYTFTDSTGAEYRLTNNVGGVWSSAESIYLSFDSNADVLHFPDGSFWTMGAVSAGSEQDAGTLYPTVMEDTNGNQVLLTYDAGAGVSWTNSSARIITIADVRAVNDGYGNYWTYKFSYNYGGSGVPTLTSIANSIGTGETYSFNYATSSLVDPFSLGAFGSAIFLLQANVLANGTNYYFGYDGSNTYTSGDLYTARLPYLGYLQWVYAQPTYTGSRTQLEVGTRYLSKDGLTPTAYPFHHESNTSSLTIHACTTIDDPGLLGEKYWIFSPSGANQGLVTNYQGRSQTNTNCNSSIGVAMTENDFTWVQDAVGNNYIGTVVTTADPGTSNAKAKSTTQTVDTHGNVTSVTNNNYPGLTPASRTTNYTYVTSGNYASVTTSIYNRLSSAVETDSNGNSATLATISYDCYPYNGCSATGATPTPREWDTNYNSVQYRGNATSISTLSGTTTVVYDLYGNTKSTTVNGVTSTATTTSATNYAAPSAITVGSLSTTMDYSSFLGLTNETGPSGTSVSIGYDAAARPQSTTSPFGAGTTTAYNDTASPPNTCTGIDGRWTQTNLDGLGRPVTTLTGYGSACGQGTTVSQSETTYGSCGCSPAGKMMSQSVPHAPGATGTAVAWTTYTYDGIGRTLTKSTVGAVPATGSTPDTQGTASYTYSGNTVTVKDPAGVVKVFTMDGFGNLAQVVENPSGLNYLTTYTYDLLNHLTGVTMTRSTGTQTRSFVYSGNYLVSATNPENGTVSYTYNSYGKVATRLDNKSPRQYVVYTYDSYARLTMVQRYPSGQGTTEDTCQQENYYYDGAVPTSFSYSDPSGYGNGHLTAVQYWGGYNPNVSPSCDTTFTEIYNYGQPGAPIAKQLSLTRTLPWYGENSQQTKSVTLAASFTYDTEGRMTAEKYPADVNGATASLSYTFDQMGRLNTMTDALANGGAGQVLIPGATYGPANELLSISQGSGYASPYLGESRSYNSLKQLTGIASGSVWVSYGYPAGGSGIPGNSGKIQTQTDGVTGETITYAYDALNRLMSESSSLGGSASQTFGYDGFGNLTQVNGNTVGSYDANNHGGGEDANGNPGTIPMPANTTTGLATATYDVENRLVQAVGTGTSATSRYSYAPGNKRVWKGVGAFNSSTGDWTPTDEVTFWSVSGQKMATYQLTTSTGVGPPSPVPPAFYATQTEYDYYFGAKLIKNGNTASSWVYSDRLGSIGKFYPYGVERTPTGNGTEKYTGYFRDAETGNDYADQRYMSPGAGRFITPDRMSGTPSDPSSWNKYAYTGGDPINRVDSSGRYYTAPVAPNDPGGCVETDFDGCVDPGVCQAGISEYPDPNCYYGGGPVAGPQKPSQPQQPLPAYLVVMTDCYVAGSIASGHAERDITYQLYGNNGQIYTGAYVTEQLTGSGLPVTGTTSSGLAGGLYEDTQSLLLYSLTGVSVMNLQQTFTATTTISSISPPVTVQLFVQGFGGQFGTLGLYITPTAVYINGNSGLNANGTPITTCSN